MMGRKGDEVKEMKRGKREMKREGGKERERGRERGMIRYV